MPVRQILVISVQLSIFSVISGTTTSKNRICLSRKRRKVTIWMTCLSFTMGGTFSWTCCRRPKKSPTYSFIRLRGSPFTRLVRRLSDWLDSSWDAAQFTTLWLQCHSGQGKCILLLFRRNLVPACLLGHHYRVHRRGY